MDDSLGIFALAPYSEVRDGSKLVILANFTDVFESVEDENEGNESSKELFCESK